MTAEYKYFRYTLAIGMLVMTVLALIATAPTLAAKLSFGAKANKPLAVDEAYVASVLAEDRNTLTVAFDIADGYYLYRDKTQITSHDVTVSTPVFPKATMINDEFFGDMATYRDRVEIGVPIEVSNATNNVELNVKFQGCADMGLCYPPTTYQLQVELPDAPEPKSGALAQVLSNGSRTSSIASDPLPQSNVVSRVRPKLDLLGLQSEAPILPPEHAFIPSATVDGSVITVNWMIEPDYYLYKDKLKFSLAEDAASVVGVEYSESVMQTDEFFGDVLVFRHEATATISTANQKKGNATLEIGYQGCADVGVCFPPKVATLPVTFASSADPAIELASMGGTAVTGQTGKVETTPVSAQVPQSEQNRIRDKLSTSSLWINAASFFVLGLLLSFTPCVFPMIPILSSLILGQGKSISTGKAFGLSLTYVLAMAITYTLVGVFIGLSGYNLQAWFQNPWILSAFALIFVLLSLSMFGFYEIQMPTAIQSKLNSWSNKQEGGKWISVGTMGVLSALIVGPCVTAPLVGALIYIAETGDATVGGVALFSMSMGMGLPLLIIGTSAGKWMPKAGAWMDITKVVFGLAMLAMAIWMLSRFLPGNVIVVFSAMLAIFGGVYLATTTRFGSTISWFNRSIGLVILLYGVALMMGMLSGNSSLITPLASMGGGAATQKHELEFERIKNESDLDRVLGEAAATGQFVLLDYYADWCVSCKEMEAYTFTDPEVQRSLEEVRVIQVDVTKNDAEDQAMLKRFGLFGPPAILFFEPSAGEVSNARVVGYMKAAKFNAHLNTIFNSKS